MIVNLEDIKSRLDVHKALQTIGYPGSDPKKIGSKSDEVHDFCPVHGGDHGRNFSVNTTSKAARCYTCHFKGDIITAHMEANGLGFLEALDGLARDQGIEVIYQGATKNVWRTTGDVINEAVPMHSSSLHPYLIKKGVGYVPGLLRSKDRVGHDCVLVPLSSVDGLINGYQTVRERRPEAGDIPKCFLSKNFHGSFFLLGTLSEEGEVYIAEGIATAGTIWEALDKNKPVVSLGAAWNIPYVAKALKERYPNLRLIFCLDDSRAAFEQVKKLGGEFDASYRLPHFERLTTSINAEKGLADFNDIVSKCGQSIEVVRGQLAKALSFDELPFDKYLSQTAVAAKEAPRADGAPLTEDSEYSTALISDLELDSIRYILNRSFNDIVDTGVPPDEFEITSFIGAPVKEGKQTISLHRTIVEIIKKSWNDDDGDLALTITDIALRSGEFSTKIHAILSNIECRQMPTAQGVIKRLSNLKENSSLSQYENIIKKMREGKILPESGLDLLRGEIERNRAKSHIVQSDDFFEDKFIEDDLGADNNFVATEFSDLNLLLKGGLRGGKLITLQGKAGSGKSTFMIQVRDYLARQGLPVIFVTMEQTRKELRDISRNRMQMEIRETKKGLSIDQLRAESAHMYSVFCKNIYTIEGSEHLSIHGSGVQFLTLSRVGEYIRNVIHQTNKKPVVFIDPFQRLSTGYKELDSSEYDKINALVALMKYLAINLDITIIAASDVTKDHESNISGEGSGRGTYMIQHLSDVIISFKESEESAYEALFGEPRPETSLQEDSPPRSKAGQSRSKKLTRHQFAVIRELDSLKPALRNDQWDSEKWVALVVSKNRGHIKFSPLFIFESGARFKEVPIWGKIYKPIGR
jgi:KaiC/GvpD/RAD55 family RecA-like ATPase